MCFLTRDEHNNTSRNRRCGTAEAVEERLGSHKFRDVLLYRDVLSSSLIYHGLYEGARKTFRFLYLLERINILRTDTGVRRFAFDKNIVTVYVCALGRLPIVSTYYLIHSRHSIERVSGEIISIERRNQLYVAGRNRTFYCSGVFDTYFFSNRSNK